jgi:hypothetical protein
VAGLFFGLAVAIVLLAYWPWNALLLIGTACGWQLYRGVGAWRTYRARSRQMLVNPPELVEEPFASRDHLDALARYGRVGRGKHLSDFGGNAAIDNVSAPSRPPD